jgi:phage terminase small subunit
MDFSEIELGPRMQALPERERKFVWFYLTNEGPPNGAQAARDAGYSDRSEGAKVRAHALLHRERVILALEEVGKKAFRGLLGPAVKATAAMIQNEKHVRPQQGGVHDAGAAGAGEKSTVDVNVGAS